MPPRSLLIALALALLTTGCATLGSDAAVPLVRAHATTDLDCPDHSIRVEEEFGGRYKAVGCGRKAYYRSACVGLSCEVRSWDEAPIPSRDRSDPSDPIQPR
jgi:hypothetical protein